MAISTADPIAMIDDMLTSHVRFGDSARIGARVRSRAALALEIAGIASSELDEPALAHPFVCRSVERYLRAVSTSHKEQARLKDLRAVLALSAAQPPSSAQWLTIQSGNSTCDIDSMTAEVIESLLSGGSEVIGELFGDDSEMDEQLKRASGLLVEVLPKVGASVLSHVRAVAPIRGTSKMGTVLAAACGDLLPGTIVFDTSQLADPWEAAGHMLHEALHLKLFDISRSGRLVLTPETQLHVPWRTQVWDVRRALVSFHVYSHMVVFQTAADRAGYSMIARHGKPGGHLAVGSGLRLDDETTETAFGRTKYLAERLQGDLAHSLSPDGKELIAWLLACIEPVMGGTHAIERKPEAFEQPDCRFVEQRYKRLAGLQSRPCATTGELILLSTTNGRMFFLNLAVWAAFELCNGQADLKNRYLRLLAPKVGAVRALELLSGAISTLLANDLIRLV